MGFLTKHVKRSIGLKPSKSALNKEYKRQKQGKIRRKAKPKFGKWKWAKQIAEHNVKLGVFNGPMLNIYFNTEHEHFFLEQIDSMGRKTRLNNTYSVSYVEALMKALKKAKKLKLIKNGRSMAPDPEEEEENK